eukprot:3934805-Rhodomonas_salina.5
MATPLVIDFDVEVLNPVRYSENDKMVASHLAVFRGFYWKGAFVKRARASNANTCNNKDKLVFHVSMPIAVRESTTLETPFIDSKHISENPMRLFLEFHHIDASRSEFRFATSFWLPDLLTQTTPKNSQASICLQATNNNMLMGNNELREKQVPDAYNIQITLRGTPPHFNNFRGVTRYLPGLPEHVYDNSIEVG